MCDRALSLIRRENLLARGDGVLIGLSGGPDSVALTLVLEEISSAGDLPLKVHLAHLNHCLRGAESDEEEGFCREFSHRHTLPLTVERIDVRAAAGGSASLEASARRLRYDFLRETAAQLGLTKVATGHHADDVAETVLMRLIRGCGIHGLGALQPSRPLCPDGKMLIVRPLLELKKAELLDYVRRQGETWCTDSSNADASFLRNRIRHELLPLLSRYAGFSVESLCALNRAAAEAAELLDDIVAARWDKLCREQGPGFLAFDIAAYRSLRPVERKTAVRHAVKRLGKADGKAPALRAEHYDAVSALAGSSVGAAVSLPASMVARREHDCLYLGEARAKGPLRPRELTVPGRVSLGEIALRLAAEVLSGSEMKPEIARRNAGKFDVFVRLDGMALPLAVRGRQAGDRFQPLGAGGRCKLKDFFIDNKVPLHRRDQAPLVVTARDEIVWVVGWRIAEPFKLSGCEKRVLHLQAFHTT